MTAAPLAPDLGAVPADVERPPVPTVTWPEGKEPDFAAWMQYAGDRAIPHQEGTRRLSDSGLAAWVRHRLVQPEPHVVYLLRLATGAFYVGIASERRFERRMVEHQRSARRQMAPQPADLVQEIVDGVSSDTMRAYPLKPREAWVMRHGWDKVETAELVPDRVCALLLEAFWTCVLHAAGVRVFGNWPGDLCPAGAWIERPPFWSANES